MDKYFSSSYDPRLDVSLTSLTHSNGLIADGGFDEWDSMLRVMKEKKEAKEEKEWREKVERKRERERVRSEREARRARRRGEDTPPGIREIEEMEVKVHGPSVGAVGRGMMDMQYVKKGETRSWDLGKFEPT